MRIKYGSGWKTILFENVRFGDWCEAAILRSLHAVATGRSDSVVPRKICFKHIIKTKILSSKSVFFPWTLKPGCGPEQCCWWHCHALISTCRQRTYLVFVNMLNFMKWVLNFSSGCTVTIGSQHTDTAYKIRREKYFKRSKLLINVLFTNRKLSLKCFKWTVGLIVYTLFHYFHFYLNVWFRHMIANTGTEKHTKVRK